MEALDTEASSKLQNPSRSLKLQLFLLFLQEVVENGLLLPGQCAERVISPTRYLLEQDQRGSLAL